MYIHSPLAAAKDSPQNRNCQFRKTERQKVHDHPNGTILARASLSQTCPAESRMLCKTAKIISLIRIYFLVSMMLREYMSITFCCIR